MLKCGDFLARRAGKESGRAVFWLSDAVMLYCSSC